MQFSMKPIEVLAWFEYDGTPHPARYRMDNRPETKFSVISKASEKLAGNKMLIFECQNDELGRFTLKFELLTCKWYLWKM